ncbi:eukaryotic translation initiation factor 3 subunit F-like [Limulus polyphemus]|uniref:Eukaryotic translation initiation factor 3 subunit F n=1 Tax=Limulus polyphemus TaxID=6850 RepID=A0ABM1BWQ6_LIMPO|nr:eukaryotic translation initiation factor 3 subunit F-like [Limulus polyphemus]
MDAPGSKKILEWNNRVHVVTTALPFIHVLKMSPNLIVKVHPVILFSIVDSYERRHEGANRVIGTLLGIQEKGAVEVTNCFCVPHNELEDEVAINMEFAKDMFEFHRRVNPSEVIVGWYATGPDVTEHSVLIHDYYSREANNPIHLTVDTFLTEGHLSIKPYTRYGTILTCKQNIGYAVNAATVKVCQGTKFNKQKSVECKPDFDQITGSTRNIQELLDIVIGYVDDVLAGRTQADNSVGRALMDMVQSVPQMNPEEFQEMLNSNMKDLLMVVYLSQLTKTQLTLHEKLTYV